MLSRRPQTDQRQTSKPSEPMPLQPGQRIAGSGRNAYVIGECREATPWYRLYWARKVFFNYRYEQREFYEAREDEWIEVLIREAAGSPLRVGQSQPATTGGPHRTPLVDLDASQLSTPNPQLLTARLRYETTQVLAGQPGWFPEPVDWLQTSRVQTPESGNESQQDLAPDAGFSTLDAPLLVMSHPRGERLDQWRAKQRSATPMALRIAAEMLDLLQRLHGRGQTVGGFGPRDFLIDETGRLFFMATDRVIPMAHSQQLRPVYPPERYPTGFAPPEVNDSDGPLDVRSDLYSWAAVALALLDESSVAGPESGAGPSPRLAALNSQLSKVAERDAEALWAWLPRRDRRSVRKLISLWLRCLERCLAVAPRDRLPSVEAIRRLAARRLPIFSWR